MQPDVQSLKQQRDVYVELYSKEMLSEAFKKATRHRARARKYGLIEHFTAWEWLDLCKGFDFKCYLCNDDGPLEPHHYIPLSRGGTNTIDNIKPICSECHNLLHLGAVDCSKIWLSNQHQLMRMFHVGDSVRRSWNLRALPGVIVQIIPFKYGKLPLWGHLIKGVPIIPITKYSEGWTEAKACVLWPRGRTIVGLGRLSKNV